MTMGDVDLSVVTINTKGLGIEKKRRKIFNYLHEHDFSLIALQETHSTPKIEKIWQAEWGGKIIYAHGTSAARGVALLINRKTRVTIQKVESDVNGRYLIASLKFADVIDLVCTVLYAPNTDEPEFFVDLMSKSEQSEGRKIYLGDFNTILDKNKDIKGGKGYSHVNCTKFLNEYMDNNNLVDIWRFQHPEEFRSTYIQEKSSIASLLMERIDFILIEDSLVQMTIESGIKPAFNSDHAQPFIVLKSKVDPPGAGYWKFNNKLLEDDKFVTEAIRIMTSVLSDTALEIFQKWELMKFSVKQAAIIRGAEIKKSDTAKLHLLRKKLDQIVSERDNLNIDSPESSTVFVDHNNQIMAVNSDIDEILNKRTEAAMHRSRANWYQCAEKPSRYFFALEKNNYNRKVINKIRASDNTIVEGTQNVLKVFNEYYGKLFSRQNIDIDPDYLALLDIPQVKEKDKYWLEGEIQLEEIHLALKQLNLAKCPGTDGLTVEFYLKFWPILATTIHKLFRTITEKKTLNPSGREAITSLMGKPLRDPLDVKNWRPLSILNNDYKLYAKVLCNRMTTVAAYLIPKEQKGFMKNRHISDNLLNLLTTVEFCHKNEIDSCLVAVDFHQAFDSCNWDALQCTLQAFGYGPKFIQMIMNCYTDIKMAIMNNNTWSSWIYTKSGVKQGCPLSGILFNHLISVLALKIQQNQEIEGIKINGETKKTDMFADDLWNSILYKESTFQELMFEFAEFQSFSGLSINYNKTEIMRMGSIRNTNAKFYSNTPLLWSDGPVKILGINIFPSWEETVKNNYDGMLNKIANIFKMWSARTLTPIGKIQIVNSLVNSQFLYKFQVLSAPDGELMHKIKKRILKFMWGNSKPKIAYNRLIASYSEGGLQLRDLNIINKSIKLSILGKIIDKNNDEIWKHYLETLMGVDLQYLLKCNMSPKDIQNNFKKSVFSDALYFWAQNNHVQPHSVNEILNQNIWFNSYIRKQNKWIFNKEMYEKKILRVVDIFDLDEGSLLSYQEFQLLFPDTLDYLSYYSICSSIPKSWKNILKRNEPSPDQKEQSWLEKFEQMCKGKLSTNLYNFFRDNSSRNNQALLHIWNNDLKITMDQKMFCRLFINLRKLTKSTKLRYFQYRILVKALTTNTHVSKWNANISSKCTFCKNANETVVHLFAECVLVKTKIWKPLISWIKYMHKFDLKITSQNILFNNYYGRFSDFVNMHILIAKFYIYRAKVQSATLNFSHYINELNRIKVIEKTIARINNCTLAFSKKWLD